MDTHVGYEREPPAVAGVQRLDALERLRLPLVPRNQDVPFERVANLNRSQNRPNRAPRRLLEWPPRPFDQVEQSGDARLVEEKRVRPVDGRPAGNPVPRGRVADLPVTLVGVRPRQSLVPRRATEPELVETEVGGPVVTQRDDAGRRATQHVGVQRFEAFPQRVQHGRRRLAHRLPVCGERRQVLVAKRRLRQREVEHSEIALGNRWRIRFDAVPELRCEVDVVKPKRTGMGGIGAVNRPNLPGNRSHFQTALAVDTEYSSAVTVAQSSEPLLEPHCGDFWVGPERIAQRRQGVGWAVDEQARRVVVSVALLDAAAGCVPFADGAVVELAGEKRHGDPSSCARSRLMSCSWASSIDRTIANSGSVLLRYPAASACVRARLNSRSKSVLYCCRSPRRNGWQRSSNRCR